jgi:poly(beta-D-mannuronate) C5 epimerase
MLRRYFSGLILAVIAWPALALPQSASAASNCPTTALKWSSTSNVLVISGKTVSCTPADLNTIQPLRVVRVANGKYIVKANLRFTEGAKFDVAGTSIGGTTNELRLLSNNASGSSNVISVIADYGAIKFDHTRVTSWNETSSAPDLEHSTFERAYIEVRSRFVDGVANTSRMDILNSDIGNLGHSAPGAFGLSWKVINSDFSSVDVLGNIIGSRIHGNYFGVYTYGAYGMRIDSNEFDHNVQYGLDLHDDSDSLIINNNRSHQNGDHGIICSQRCDHLTITNNTSANNSGHGIMLHRSVDFSLVENNTLTGNVGCAIALFESNNNMVRGNTITGNEDGIRLSGGASLNQFKNNVIQTSAKYGIDTYKSLDVVARGDGINRNNTWTSNKVSGSGLKALRLGATEQDAFTANDFRRNGVSGFDITGATKTTFNGNLTDSGRQPGSTGDTGSTTGRELIVKLGLMAAVAFSFGAAARAWVRRHRGSSPGVAHQDYRRTFSST